MTVYIVVGSDVIYGVFSSERKALNYGYRHFGDAPGWDVECRRVDE